MFSIDDFPFIKEVALEIAFDSGFFDRSLSQEDFLKGVEACIFADGVYEKDVKALNNWLGTLSKEDRDTVACGEHSEMVEIAKGSPKGDGEIPVVGLLDDIFKHDYRNVGD